MKNKSVEILERALAREREARKLAEKILEEKSLELFEVTNKLKDTNEELKELIRQKTSELKGVFENIIDAYVVIDLNGNVLKMNDAATVMFGYENQESAINLLDLLHEEDYEYTIQAFKKLLEEGSFTKYKSRILTKKNELKILEVNCSVIYNDSGKPVAAQGIARDVTKEIALNELLEEQKDQLNIIIDNSPIGISLSKQNSRGLLLANKSLCKMLGYTEKEFQNMQVQDITHPDDVEISRLNLEKLFKGEVDNFLLEKRYIKKNGDVLWAKTTVTAVRNSKQEIKFQVATIEDITNERLAKEQLIESENRLSSLILNLDSGVLLEDENRKIILTNKKFCELFSIPAAPAVLKGQDCSDSAEQAKNLFEDPEKFVSRIKELIEEKKVVLGDELKMEDGKILERDYIPIFLNNKYKGHLWTYKDVTLRRKYRKSLEAQKQKYSSIIANMHLGLIEVDNEDQVLLANQSFLKMTGYTEEELVGKKLKNILLDEDTRKIIKNKINERKQGKSDSYELEIRDKYGKKQYWLVSGAPNFGISGKITGTIGIILDITNIKNLEIQKENLLKRLKQSNEELQEYAHIVSHDLKSPLRSISALTSWLKEDYGSVLEGDGVKNINLIEATLEKMDRLISDILSYSSINKDQSVVEDVNVGEVVNHIKSLIFIPPHVEVIVDEKLPVIRADKTRIQQLFQNLISNAVNYIDKEKGKVEIKHAEEKDGYIFSIQDNGVGIPKEYHQKIFNIFQSIGNHKDSTGIGLSIVKKIVDMYDGKIWLESKQGTGTTFFIKFKK
ncbi:PAS domain-containing sensor histidine kinase [Abyssalbus ytuae]|uniref:histidine kinase n=1 Tax=Abyssalbus ytuae TaxID=2926907 RepID=A0A9E7D399_9FLAO|nr:PAS domain S-box protein [Abyssalbus ytuae]UOB19073.1 PAS domain S-box protein [Abyssalbus ytuae]